MLESTHNLCAAPDAAPPLPGDAPGAPWYERIEVEFGTVAAAGRLTVAQLQGCVVRHADDPAAALECCRAAARGVSPGLPAAR